MDRNEPHWRTNSSFSPPGSRRWDCRFQSDALPRGSRGAPLHGSSFSSNSKGSRSRVSSDQYPNHHHSVSDGVLSYFGSPSDNYPAPQWTPPVPRVNIGEFSSPTVGGSRSEVLLFPQSTEGAFTAGASAVSNSLESTSPHSDASLCESIGKQTNTFPHRNFSSRCSFISKPVYPLMFRSPVSDAEACGSVDTSKSNRVTSNEKMASPQWPETTASHELNFHKTLTELQKMQASPDLSASSRREGFRWSNASSYEFGFDRDTIDIAENIDIENFRSPNNSAEGQKCGLCARLLWQKSPWSSHWIIRSGDMPTTGVLSCSHVYHAECLEQSTPKTETHDPPCPLCLKLVHGPEESSLGSELHIPTRSASGHLRVKFATHDTGNSNQFADFNEEGLRRNRSLQISRGGSNSLIKNHLKKHFSFKGRTGKDLWGAKMFGRSGSSSSALYANQNQVGSSRSGQLTKREA